MSLVVECCVFSGPLVSGTIQDTPAHSCAMDAIVPFVSWCFDWLPRLRGDVMHLQWIAAVVELPESTLYDDLQDQMVT